MPTELACEVNMTPPPGKLMVLPGGSIYLQSATSIPIPPPVRNGAPAQMVSGRFPTFLYMVQDPQSSGKIAHLVLSISLEELPVKKHVEILKYYEGEDLIQSCDLVVTRTPVSLGWTSGHLHLVRCSLSSKAQSPFHKFVPPPVGGSSWLQDCLLPRRIPGAIRVCSPTHFQLFALLT